MQNNTMTTVLSGGLAAAVLFAIGCDCTTGSQMNSCEACGPVVVPTQMTAPKFVTSTDDEGRLWILRPGEEHAEKHITMVGAGPGGVTVKALNKATVIEYLAQKPGFETAMDGDRLWVFKAGEGVEMPEKHITMIGVGPLGATLKAKDRALALTYLAAKPGFAVTVDDGRLWVYRAEGPIERKEKHVTLVGAGPSGMTVKALDRETAVEYLAKKVGFTTKLDGEGRLWVFRRLTVGEMPEKHVTRVGAGPLGTTLKAVDRDTMAAYLAAR